MKKKNSAAVEALLSQDRDQVLTEWRAELGSSSGNRGLGIDIQGTEQLLDAVLESLRGDGTLDNFEDKAWDRSREFLSSLSRSRAAQGSTAADTSRFVLALKKPLFSGLQRTLVHDPAVLVGAVWEVSSLVDDMAQFTVTAYQRTREEIIARQQQELLELSTPVIKMWEGVLAVPMIGTLDSGRTQLVM